MENMAEIVKLLEQQVVNKTLSLDGIKEVQKIIDSNKSLSISLEEAIKHKDKLSKEKQDLFSDKQKLQEEIKELTKECARLKSMEDTFKANEIEAKYLHLRADEMKEIVGMALRNPVITNTREKSMNTSGTGESGNFVCSNKSTTETVTQEVK